MQISHHLATHPVADEQQRRRARLPAFAAAGLLGAALGAAAPAAAAEPASSPPPQRSYGAVLGGSYLLAPLLALGVGGLFAGAEASDEVAVFLAAPMFLLPAAVHLYQGDPGAKARAGLSLATMAGMTLGGTFAGGIGGYVENLINCDPDTNSECGDRVIGAVIIGAVVGTGVGYIGSGVVDVIFRSDTEPEPAPGAVSTQLWVAPVNGERSAARPVGERSARPGSLAAADGVVMGMTVRW